MAIVGVPFDSGGSYRPGARFGPGHVCAASKLLRNYNPVQDAEPFAVQQVADTGDLACNPFDITEAVRQIDEGARAIVGTGARLMTIGGDRTIALPLLRVMHELRGPIAVVHFDALLDTWDTCFGAPVTHGTPFRRASEEGLIDKTGSMHVGIRGPSTPGRTCQMTKCSVFRISQRHRNCEYRRGVSSRKNETGRVYFTG